MIQRRGSTLVVALVIAEINGVPVSGLHKDDRLPRGGREQYDLN